VHTLYLVSVFFHVVAAMTWIGGMLFLVLVMVPLLRKPEMRARAAELFHLFGVRFRVVGWVALATLVVTGITNLLGRGIPVLQLVTGQVFAGAWGRTLAWKLAFVAAVLAMSVVHDFWLGPMATRLARQGAPAETREHARRWASRLGRATLLCALAIVALAVSLVRG